MPTFPKSWLCAPIEAGTAAPPKAGQIPECLLGSKDNLLCEAGVEVLGDRGRPSQRSPLSPKKWI